MPLSFESLRKVANLARIGVPDEELRALHHDLEGVLSLVGALQTADVDGVEPLIHPGDGHLSLREDRPETGVPTEQLLANAPMASDALFLVPQVLEGGPDA